jgi:CRISPR-associated protein Cmr1
MNTREIKATFEIVTPMFVGDGDQEARIIRPQSFKAELLFWWRALHYAGYVEEAKGDQLKALEAMYEDELKLFGSAKRQAAFLLSVNAEENDILPVGNVLLNTGKSAEPPFESGKTNSNAVQDGTRYLGYGVLQSVTKKKQKDQGYVTTNIEYYGGQLIRPCFAPGGTFRIRLVLRPKSGAEALVPSFINALKIMGLLGGLGSRKRRGFGSIAMTGMMIGAKLQETLKESGLTVEDFVAPSDKASYQASLKSLIGKPMFKRKDFLLSAFCADTDLRLWASPQTSAMEALEAIGAEFQQYRGWGFGHPPKVAGVASRKNFETDHHWFKKTNGFTDWKSGRPNTIPERAIFGLPWLPPRCDFF